MLTMSGTDQYYLHQQPHASIHTHTVQTECHHGEMTEQQETYDKRH